MTNREIETAKFLEVAHARFVKHVVVSKQKRLPHVPLSETVENWFADTVFAVGNAVDDRLAFAREVVSVRTVAKRELALRGHDTTIRRDFQRLGHGRVQLRRLFGVTLDAGLIADVTNAARV